MVAALLMCASCSATPGPSAAPSPTKFAPDRELFAPMMKSCLERAGYAVTIRDDGGITGNTAPDGVKGAELQKANAKYDAALQACLKETGFDLPARISPEEDYQHYLKVNACYRSLGYDVVDPTFEQFTHDGGPRRMDALPKAGEALNKAIAACER